ncbi:hypothetical protein MACH17_06340 [Phaeobacter inhibens]|nr:hypothetical protein MACH17_06340 [Phaeobacter inhibens]
MAGPLGNHGQCGSDKGGYRVATTNSDDQRYDTSFSLDDIAAGEMFGSLEIGSSSLSSNVNTCLVNAGISADAYDVTLGALWVADSQLYIDGQFRYGHFDGDLSLNGQKMVGFDGNGYEVSVEVGKSFALLNDVTLIPQAQLMYSDIEGQIETGRIGAKVDRDTLMARFGLRAEHTLADNAMLYGQIDVYHAFENESSVMYGQDTAALSIGGIVAKSDRAQLYAEITSETGLGSSSGDHSFSWNIGFAVQF